MRNNQKQSLELHTTTPDHGTIRLIMAENDRERSHSLRLMRNGFLDIKVEKR